MTFLKTADSGLYGRDLLRPDRMRTALPRKARLNSDEVMIEFARRTGGLRTSEDRNIFDLMSQRKSNEITLELTDDQYGRLRS
jgi:hypothetical protein